MSATPLLDHSIRIAIDRGGTFCDAYASWPSPTQSDPDARAEYIFKILSQNPDHYTDAPTECVRRILSHVTSHSIPRSAKLSTTKIDVIRLSTTVGTNALLERNGAQHALLVTKGFKDLLEIGNQSRPRIFDLDIQRPEQLYDQVVEVDERVTLCGYTSDPKHQQRQVKFDAQGKPLNLQEVGGGGGVIKQGVSGEAVQVIKEPDQKAVRRDLQRLYDQGYRAIAVLLLHSYTYPDHEQLIGRIASEVGFTQISLSSALSQSIKAVPRGMSATCDAYLTPVLQDYINGFFAGFDASLRQNNTDNSRATTVEFMASDGGLADVSRFSGLKSILSGPAGGVVGAALTSYDSDKEIPVVSFDMGGTSTDVSRYDGAFETVFESTTAGIALVSPQLDIQTVASGGGSRLFLRNGLFVVGPQSAGSHPGPSAYGKGGPLAVTDANLLLGRLQPEYFPKIFGASEDQPLDVQATRRGFEELEKQVHAEVGTNNGEQKMSLDEIAYGYLKVSNELMAKPIRSLTESRGYDTAKHLLCAFGGAGGQHACSIAKTLGMKIILIHAFSSVLSAYGMALSDRVTEVREPAATPFSDQSVPELKQRLEGLKQKAKQELSSQGFAEKHIVLEGYLNLRYDGTDTSLFVSEPEDWNFVRAFEKTYQQEFGFLLNERNIVVDDLRVKGVGKTHSAKLKSALAEREERTFTDLNASKDAETRVSVYFEPGGRMETPLYQLDKLDFGSRIRGPALILQETQTIVVDPDATAHILEKHVLIQLD